MRDTIIVLLTVFVIVIGGTILLPTAKAIGILGLKAGTSLSYSLERVVSSKCDPKYDKEYYSTINSRLFCPEKKGKACEL